MTPDTPIEISPGVDKSLDECTREDLEAAAELHRTQALAEMGAPTPGRRNRCDGRHPGGGRCDRDAEFVLSGADSSGRIHRSLCAAHHAAGLDPPPP